MGIASDLPFEFRLLRNVSNIKKLSAGVFFSNEEEAWNSIDSGFSAEENEEIQILFQCDDADAVLYTDALDIIPPKAAPVQTDDNGNLFIAADTEYFYLYRHDDAYDALCVDTFLIRIRAYGKDYFSVIRITPKPINENEWVMMIDDLEKEAKGLAEDLLKKQIRSKGNGSNPKIMHDSYVFMHSAQQLLPVIMDIAGSPRYTITTAYEAIPANRMNPLDEKGIRYRLRKGNSARFDQVAGKVIDYDIQDNRILKMVLNYINHSLNAIRIDQKDKNSKTAADFSSMVIKLKGALQLITASEWFMNVSEVTSPYISQSFFMDSRYGYIYEIYQKLRSDEDAVMLDPRYHSAWKQSSILYEMWCYIKICRILEKNFSHVSGNITDTYSGEMYFPFLESGSKISFRNDELRLDVIYDDPLEFNSARTSASDPVYMASTAKNRHNRPDILINVFDERIGWYIGSMVIECKYRKLNSFWGSGTWSSITQFQSYYSNARSEYQYGGKGKILQTRPVRKVIILTPDQTGDGSRMRDFHVEICGFKPSEDNRWIRLLEQQIAKVTEEMKEAEKILI